MTMTTSMKSLLTHALAVVIGATAVLLWPRSADNPEASAVEHLRPKQGQHGSRRSSTADSSNSSTRKSQRPMKSELSKPITRADLAPWLESRKGDSHAFGEALVVAGLLTDDPDLVRRGIETDPENAQLLFIGATLTEFSNEERLALGKRLLAADPDNALSGFVGAALFMDAGQSNEAIDVLKRATALGEVKDFRIPTEMLMEDAYAATGLSPEAAKIRSAMDSGAPYLSDLSGLVTSLKELESSLPPEAAAELRSVAARMGQQITTQSRSGSALNHLSGLHLEETLLRGLPADAPSAYEGLTVGEARESIAAERQQVRKALEGLEDVEDLFSSDPALMSRYLDRVRAQGEVEAAKWLAKARTPAK